MNNVTNPVFAAEQTSKMNTLKWELGENGSPQLTEYGMCSDTGSLPEYCGALCALSTKLTRGTTSKKPIAKGNKQHSTGSNIGCNLQQINNLINNVNIALTSTVGFTAGPESRALTKKVLEDLILMTFNLRDVRGTYGRGERTLSYWMFMNLYKMRPTVLATFLREIPNYGGWMDINNLYEMTFDETWIKFLPVDKLATLRDELAMTYATQLVKDIMALDNMSFSSSDSTSKISLAAKWVPKEGRSLDKRTRMGKHIARMMYPNIWTEDFKTALKHYRTDISKLGAHLDVVERKMASVRKEWSKIDFDKMPGRAMAKRTKAWANQTKKGELRSSHIDRVTCAENYQKYITSLANGKKTAKGGVMFVHELASKLVEIDSRRGYGVTNPDEVTLFESMMDAHLNSIVEEIEKNPGNNLGNTVVMADVSGSMAGDPMAVSYAMAVLASHPKIASPAWANIVMTFSHQPEWVRLQYPQTLAEWRATKYETLLGKSWCADEAGRQLSWSEKLRVVSKMPWGMNTDFISALNLVATRANEAGVHMPNLLCISDMQWDQASSSRSSYSTYGNQPISSSLNYGPLYNFRCQLRNPLNSPTTLLRQVKERLASEPCGNNFTTILWNVRGGTTGYPCAADEGNFIEVAGFSTNMLKLFLNEGILEAPKDNSSSATTWSVLRATLDHEDYDRIRELTNLMKPWRNTDTRPLNAAEKTLLPDMKIPDSWRFSVSAGSWPSPILSRPVIKPCLPKSLHPPKLERSTAMGCTESEATYSVVDYSSMPSSEDGGAGMSSQNISNAYYTYADATQASTKAHVNSPVDVPAPPSSDSESTLDKLMERMNSLEKNLAKVTAERDSLIKSSVAQSSQDSYDIYEMKKMMEKLLANSQNS